MTRHKMSLSVEYVPDWGVQEALRELFQNCIDHGDWSYNIRHDSLELRSKDTSLSNATLLLGHSRKSDGAIGKFGEGFKLAVLVLTRLGKKVTIDTANEVWRPKLIDSRTYKTKQLVFDTEKSKVIMTDLIFTIEGLTEEELTELKNQNLHVNMVGSKLDTKYGHVIHRPGDIFVNGLFVAHMKDYKFGYNLKPEYLKLDRDRRMVRDFDLQWITSQIWVKAEDHELVLSMITDKCPDVQYLDSFIYSEGTALADTAAGAFLVEHGVDAVPVSSQCDIDRAKEQGHENIVLIPEIQQKLISRSSGWSYPPPRIVKKSPREILLDFKLLHGSDFTPEMEDDFTELIEKAEGWSN